MRFHLSPKARRTLRRVVPFGVIWFLLAQVFLISDYAAAGGFSNVPDSAIKVDAGIYVYASLAVAAVGCFVGAIELLYLNRRLVTRSLGTKLVAKTLFYLVLLTGVILVTFPHRGGDGDGHRPGGRARLGAPRRVPT